MFSQNDWIHKHSIKSFSSLTWLLHEMPQSFPIAQYYGLFYCSCVALHCTSDKRNLWEITFPATSSLSRWKCCKERSLLYGVLFCFVFKTDQGLTWALLCCFPIWESQTYSNHCAALLYALLSDHLPVLVETWWGKLSPGKKWWQIKALQDRRSTDLWGKCPRCLLWVYSDNSLHWEVPMVAGLSSKMPSLQPLPDVGRVQGDKRSL